MKQTKNKSQKSRNKQPIKAQLSGEDLKELLIALRAFTREELLRTTKEDKARADRMYKSLFNLEAYQKCQDSRISLVERQLACGARTGHLIAVQFTQRYETVFRCVIWDLEYRKSNLKLTRKEKKLLKITLKG